MINSLKAALAAGLVILSCACHGGRKASAVAAAPLVAAEDSTDVPPPEVCALMTAYPAFVTGFDGTWLRLACGDSLLFSSGKELSHDERLACKDVQSMFYDIYPLGELTEPPFQSDPGRYRNEDLFKAMYGHSQKEVSANLEKVDVFGSSVPFTKINGAADSLRAVIREVGDEHPNLKKYFNEPSSFYWRPVRGADRLSAHSFGIAIDIGVKYSNYWRWSNPGKEEGDTIKYENKFPAELIHIFERHGFISGARWYHFDTMHFEFRPDLLLHSHLQHPPLP